MKRIATAAILSSTIICSCGGCSNSSDNGSPTDAGPSRDSSKDTSVSNLDAGTTSDSGSFSLAGWVTVPGSDSACGFLTAPSGAPNVPPPIAWESCDSRIKEVDGGTLSCRQMADNWNSGVPTGTLPFGFTWSAFEDASNGRTTVAIERAASGVGLYLVADVDGPVRQAIAATSPSCDLGEFSSVSANSVIYNFEKLSSSHTLLSGGAIGGAFGSPQTLRSYSSPGGLEYAAGTTIFSEFGSKGFDLGALADGHQVSVLSTAAPGTPSEFQFEQDALFFSVSNLDYGRVQFATSDAGVADFIAFGAVTTNYAADFGTDGTDMVWTEASGHPDGGTNPWTTISTMTASFTTNPATITKRRLRSQSTYGLGTDPFVVGCGYAAHQTSDLDGTGLRVIRLSDGRSWRLLNGSVTWNAPVAISCSELFVNVNFGPTALNLVRIRLDSLGAGDPAD